MENQLKSSYKLTDDKILTGLPPIPVGNKTLSIDVIRRQVYNDLDKSVNPILKGAFMPEQTNPQVVDSVSSTNLKTLGDAPAFFQNQMFANSIAHQNRMQTISEATVGSIVKYLTEVDIREAASVAKAGTANVPDLATVIAGLSAALNANTQGVKSAVNTPPYTPT